MFNNCRYGVSLLSEILLIGGNKFPLLTWHVYGIKESELSKAGSGPSFMFLSCSELKKVKKLS